MNQELKAIAINPISIVVILALVGALAAVAYMMFSLAARPSLSTNAVSFSEGSSLDAATKAADNPQANSRRSTTKAAFSQPGARGTKDVLPMPVHMGVRCEVCGKLYFIASSRSRLWHDLALTFGGWRNSSRLLCCLVFGVLLFLELAAFDVACV